MDVLSHIENDLFGSNNSNDYGNLPRNFIGNSDEWMNLTGAYLDYYNTCKAAEAVYNQNVASYNAYMTALAAYNTAFANSNCSNTTPPAQPVLQVMVAGSGVCETKANGYATTANNTMQAAYNTAKAAYDARMATCNSLSSPTVVTNPGTFNPPIMNMAADGVPWFGATGIFDRLSPVRVRRNPYHNAVIMKGGKLNATGDSTSLNLVTILVLVGVGYLAYKFLK